MSELTKEKIYKSELIKGGATGNNNLERIRSLAGGGTVNLQNKTVTPTAQIQTITADEGYDGLGTVTVEAETNTIDDLLKKQLVDLESNMSGSCYGVKGFYGIENMIFSRITFLMEGAFENCSSLKTISLDRAPQIRERVFWGCDNLESITIKDKLNVARLYENVFDGNASGIVVYVPSEILSSYQADANWSDLVSRGVVELQAITE